MFSVRLLIDIYAQHSVYNNRQDLQMKFSEGFLFFTVRRVEGGVPVY